MREGEKERLGGGKVYSGRTVWRSVFAVERICHGGNMTDQCIKGIKR